MLGPLAEKGPAWSISLHTPTAQHHHRMRLARKQSRHAVWLIPSCSYFTAGDSGPPLLLIHGFGVGAWHYEKNIAALAQNHRVFAIDILGQGEILDFCVSGHGAWQARLLPISAAQGTGGQHEQQEQNEETAGSWGPWQHGKNRMHTPYPIPHGAQEAGAFTAAADQQS